MLRPHQVSVIVLSGQPVLVGNTNLTNNRLMFGSIGARFGLVRIGRELFE